MQSSQMFIEDKLKNVLITEINQNMRASYTK